MVRVGIRRTVVGAAVQPMKRLVRKASLPIALSLIASTAIADSDSTWVLWRHAIAGPEGLDGVIAEIWHPIVAYADKGECERTMLQIAPNGLIREYRTMPTGDRGEMVAILHCFPEKRK